MEILAVHISYGARPIVTDNARITDSGACQLEPWRRANPHNHEFWALPACNPAGNLELTLGGNGVSDGRGDRVHDIVIQAKILFRVLESGNYVAGLAVGAVKYTAPRPGEGRLSNAYFCVPISKSLLEDRVVMHINFGAQDDRDTRRKLLTRGVGSEFNLTPRFALIAQTYGDHGNCNFYQAGMRVWVLPSRWQIDSTFGAQSRHLGARKRWTIGVRVIADTFLR